ncbi:hypothetical protein HDV05_004885, partial [Chytridiales sp. JEL 0842]
KAHFLRTLPLATIYRDPRNNHVYEVKEKRAGKAYSKTGVPYFGAAVPIELQDINDKNLKLENPNRANIMVTMRKKLSQLEAINAELMTKLDIKSGYDKIVDILGKEKFFESEDDLYFVENGIIFHLKKKDMEEVESLKKYASLPIDVEEITLKRDVIDEHSSTGGNWS